MKDRKLNVQPDIPDLRDRIYNPTLRGLEVTFNSQPFADPGPLSRVKDQGKTSACTGFALSAMIEGLVYQTWNRNAQQSSPPAVISPFMLYYFARRYDEIPGCAAGAGSTARGAMKAWHKHGACQLNLWSDLDINIRADGAEWIADAFHTPLGAYYRVDHLSIPDMHAAVNETGFIYVTATIHDGWQEPKDGIVAFDATYRANGGHAFLIVGYDEEGFWIQNSWGPKWGRKGFARISYGDWSANGMDAWIAQLGVHISHRAESLAFGLPFTPVELKTSAASEPPPNLSSNTNLSAQQINPYIINLTNNGNLSDNGQFATRLEDLRDLLTFYVPQALSAWKLAADAPIDVAIYAHGGLTDEANAAQTARWWVPALFNRRVFPVFLMWETGFWDTIKDVIADVYDRYLGGAAGRFWDKITDNVENFWNERLENLVSKPGTIEWSEMKQNAEAATTNKSGGLKLLFHELQKSEYNAIRKRLRFHLIGHSAGSIVHSYLAPALVNAQLTVDGVYFLAPACRRDLFTQQLLPLFKNGKIPSYTQFHMTDIVERRDTCGSIYLQSLLYLVSNSFEHQRDTPILGMEKYAAPLATSRPAGAKIWDWIASPTNPSDTASRSNSTSHGGFDDDPDTRAAVLARIGKRQGPPPPPAGVKHPAAPEAPTPAAAAPRPLKKRIPRKPKKS